MRRDEILHRAEQVICNDRKNAYGEAEDCFSDIANLWGVYLSNSDIVLDSVDVANMMILLKIARAKSNPMHMDNWVDICGYAAIGAELAQQECGKIAKGVNEDD